MTWQPGKKQNKLSQEVIYSERYDDETEILSAEHVVASAFGRWAIRAGLDENRARAVVNRPFETLGEREQRLLVRAADEALKSAIPDTISPVEKRGE